MNLLDGVNPVTKLVAIMALTTPLLLSVDVVSATVALTAVVFLAPLCGVSWPTLARRAWPLVLATPIAGLSMALYGRPEGREYVHFLFAHVTDNSLSLALAIMVRILAVGLPVVVLATHIDPTELGDALAQVLRLPQRFVVASVAGVRLLSLFSDDWQSLSRARRSRGLAADNPITTFFSMTFALLVLAILRGTKLATAMEARGFGGPQPRTWGRASTVSWRDAAVIIVALALGVLSVVCAVWAGTFRFLGT
ncbi:energy-coupling factor transporter transmembrane component T family protein [Corynebacterium epidermidicanis]|uniref:ABC-type cobalt transport system, permease component CbiQ n=1 Tax=Corynebacterium epidermidicanis TaxID=1050174 RepID=A0A0G3GTD4_9CORY|nr:energy-coupling factor transporter transmembrane component T [Corynebacterium epidermidicanis]AKK02793.1 ABC-type cobalt transport system, permease component CbiQ [Corynebacterium epidermidicanis]